MYLGRFWSSHRKHPHVRQSRMVARKPAMPIKHVLVNVLIFCRKEYLSLLPMIHSMQPTMADITHMTASPIHWNIPIFKMGNQYTFAWIEVKLTGYTRKYTPHSLRVVNQLYKQIEGSVGSLLICFLPKAPDDDVLAHLWRRWTHKDIHLPGQDLNAFSGGRLRVRQTHTFI